MTDTTHADQVGTNDDFVALERQALELEGQPAHAAAPGAGAPGAQSVADTAAELLAALQLVREISAPAVTEWLPNVRELYSDQRLGDIAQAGAELMTIYGWTMSDVFTKWGPWFRLGAALLPPVSQTVIAYRRHSARQVDTRLQVHEGAAGVGAQPAAH